jgi:UDP:flavonoid glycosyltransferase YjiC (YdhE family)
MDNLEPSGLTGPAAIRDDLTSIFLARMPFQYAAVQAALAAEHTDAVLAEALFTGVIPLLETPRADRPLVVCLGIVPLSLPSRDTAPFGLGITPLRGPIGRVRNAVLQLVADKAIFAAVDSYGNERMAESLGRPVTRTYMDWPARADLVVQFTVEGFEYPRSDLPAHVSFVGPVSKGNTSAVAKPAWWADLDGSKPVVHVTQGTVANKDPNEVIVPTIRGLANDDVLVVVTMGGRSVDLLPDDLPANVRVAEYLPYDDLIPLVDVFVTNGGYGGVHFALQNGLPLVVAGLTEEKSEVNARVAWSGAGINLKTNTANPDATAAAVRKVLADPRYREAAVRLGTEIAASPGTDALSGLLARHVAAGR